jgi:hypothetical protein
MARDELVEVDYDEIIRDNARDKAVLFAVDDEEVWIPRSLIDYTDERAKTFYVPEWYAIKEELI